MRSRNLVLNALKQVAYKMIMRGCRLSWSKFRKWDTAVEVSDSPITVLFVFGAAASVRSGSGAAAADDATFWNRAAATYMIVCDVTVAVVNHTAAPGCTHCAKLGGCLLALADALDCSLFL